MPASSTYEYLLKGLKALSALLPVMLTVATLFRPSRVVEQSESSLGSDDDADRKETQKRGESSTSHPSSTDVPTLQKGGGCVAVPTGTVPDLGTVVLPSKRGQSGSLPD